VVDVNEFDFLPSGLLQLDLPLGDTDTMDSSSLLLPLWEDTFESVLLLLLVADACVEEEVE
jgi:hypothetical protein